MSSLTISKWIVTVVSIFFLIFFGLKAFICCYTNSNDIFCYYNKTVIWLVPRACKRKRLYTEWLPEGVIKSCLGPSGLGLSCPQNNFSWRYNKSVLYWPMTGYGPSCTHTVTHTPIRTFLQRVFFHRELSYEIAAIAPEPKISCSLMLYNFLFFPLIVRWQRHLDGLPDQATIDFSAALH